jgi:hypothetical protein
MAKKQNKYDMSVVEMSHYNIPHITENDNKDYVSFGNNNLYPQYLIELFTGSGINGAIIKGVGAMIAGDQQGTCQGLDVVDKDELDESLREQYLKFSKLLKTGSRNTIKNLAFDLKLFGTCYINVIWNKAKTAIHEIKHIPAQYIRSGKADSYGNINEYYYCYDWSNERKYKPRIIKAFNPEDRTETSQLMQVKEYNPQSFYYGIPDYVGGTDYIQLDMSIAELHLANIENNFMPSCMVNFSNGIPSDEQRQQVERKLNEKFSSSGNSGKLIITFSDGRESTPEIVPLDTITNDDKYQFLAQEVSRKVLTSHRVTSPLLFGVKAESGFGSNADELKNSYSLFNNTCIKGFQSTILEAMDQIFRINGIDSLDIYFKTLKPADFLDLDHIDAIDEQTEGVDIDEVVEDTVVAPEDEVIEQPTNEEMPSEEIEVVQDVEASYNGAQISSAIDIVAKVQEGILTKEQAIVFLIQFLQLPPQVAQGFFADTPESKPMVENLKNILKNLKKKKISSSVSEFKESSKEKVDISFFDDIGLTLDKDEWFEAYSEEIDDEKIDKRYHEFAYAPAGTPNVADSSSDIGMFRLLYRYSKTLSVNKKTGQISSREFCQKMVAKSVAGTLYRMEDLEKASTRAVNKGFGPRGSNTYSIELYCGGANCRHKWERVFYFRRIVPKGMTFVGTDGKEYQEGEYLPNGTLNNFREVSQSFANGKMPMPDDAEMRKTTWRMKNHGFLKPRRESEKSYSTKVG